MRPSSSSIILPAGFPTSRGGRLSAFGGVVRGGRVVGVRGGVLCTFARGAVALVAIGGAVSVAAVAVSVVVAGI